MRPLANRMRWDGIGRHGGVGQGIEQPPRVEIGQG